MHFVYSSQTVIEFYLVFQANDYNRCPWRQNHMLGGNCNNAHLENCFVSTKLITINQCASFITYADHCYPMYDLLDMFTMETSFNILRLVFVSMQ